MSQSDENKGQFRFAFNPFSALTTVAGGWVLYSALFIDHDLPLPHAVDAERRVFFSDEAGMLSYYADEKADGRPLVLLHSINAAGCAYEMRPLFEHYRGKRPVYALELPGFGFSERSNRIYSPALYREAILDFLADEIGAPADVVALSLSCEFAALAAHERPDAFRSLTMISPSGFTLPKGGVSSKKFSDSGVADVMHKLFSFPLWGQALFDLIATRVSINFFLDRSFEGEVDSGMVEYAYLTSHQPGARYAPLYFVSGKLFTPGVREQVYEKLEMPVLVVYDRDGFTDFGALPEVVERYENWQTARIQPTLGLPHFEQREGTAEALDSFWTGA